VSIGELDYWGQNIAPEVSKLLINYGFEELNFHKIYTSIFSPDKRSLRVAEKIGFKHEGTLKEQIYIDGEFVNELRFAIFQNEGIKYDR
jgi:RimJ/RimL family protein N-acetyltransferase